MIEIKPLANWVIEPNELSLFVAGGISDCPDWQKDFLKILSGYKELDNVIAFNPRRDNFDTSDTMNTVKQIQWEHKHLSKANVVSFWFPKETLCPITLFELGDMAYSGKRICVGVDTKYARKIDVIEQLALVDKSIEVVYTLADLAEQVREAFNE